MLPFYRIVIPEPNDGIVPLSSVESLPYAISLGHTLHCHLDHLYDIEYGLAQTVLLARTGKLACQPISAQLLTDSVTNTSSQSSCKLIQPYLR
jgi:hypothetical protein